MSLTPSSPRTPSNQCTQQNSPSKGLFFYKEQHMTHNTMHSLRSTLDLVDGNWDIGIRTAVPLGIEEEPELPAPPQQASSVVSMTDTSFLASHVPVISLHAYGRPQQWETMVNKKPEVARNIVAVLTRYAQGMIYKQIGRDVPDIWSEDRAKYFMRIAGAVLGGPDAASRVLIAHALGIIPAEELQQGYRLDTKIPHRRLQVGSLAMLGMSDKAIAMQLCTAPSTVKSHVRDLLPALGATHRADISTALIRRGNMIIAPPMPAVTSHDATPMTLPQGTLPAGERTA
jgi:DNA-binding CsgD family transcriptional regulator